MTEDDTLAAALHHRLGCPSTDEPIGQRVEAFTLTGGDGRPVRVVRCIDCGEQVLDREPTGNAA